MMIASITLRYQLLAMSLLMLQAPTHTLAQSERKLVREGNTAYEAKKFDQAEIQYRKSLEKNKTSLPAQYNLGNALFRQDKLDEAKSQYEQAVNLKDAPAADRAKAYHNLGNSLLKQEKYQESIDAYKQSLRINPADNDTRYNLAYAQAKLQQQQNQQNQNNKQDDKQEKDQQKNQNQQQQQNKDQQDKNKQQQDQQQQDQQQDQAKKDQQKPDQQKPERISKEDAEKILQALNNDEKKTQKKLNKKEAVRVRIDKQW